MAPQYLPRILDGLLQQSLASAGAVLIEGPRSTGKTFSAEQQAASALYLDRDAGARDAISVAPEIALDLPAPLLIDEWQLEATQVWNQVRAQVDRRGLPGQFILTGSSVPDDDATRHTGAGRFARVRTRTMSLFESGESSGTVSVRALLEGEPAQSPSVDLSIEKVIELVCRGGWPQALNLEPTAALNFSKDYLSHVVDGDIDRLSKRRRDASGVRRLLRALARNIAMEHKVARLVAETQGTHNDSVLARSTAYDLLDLLERIMVLDNQPAWSPHLRSRVALRNAERTHFADPSLAVAALNANHSSLGKDIATLGLLFESLVIRDLRVYLEPLGGHVTHYRDADGLEVDAIAEDSAGHWAAFQVKLGATDIDAAAATLRRLTNKVDASVMGKPTSLNVVTPSGPSYRRPDGVNVVALAALGP